jgi:hypothetical protein
VRLPECDPERLLLWPVRAVARLFCDAVHVAKYSRFSALSLFMSSCALLFVTYRVTHGFQDVLQDFVHRIFLDQLPRKVAVAIAGWVSQLISSNISSLIFRFALFVIMYAAYQLGKNAVLSISVMVALLLTSLLTFMYFRSGLHPEIFLRTERVLLGANIGVGIFSGWFWRRYFRKNYENTTVFDHEIGAVLVELKP